jgi:redox-sensitive bicupin YhaK (pirin superfamily)
MIEMVIEPRRRDLGGFEVGRVLPYHAKRMIGPFVFFDHMGPAFFAKGIDRHVDVRPHPHIGLSTVTYLFEGEIMHRDSVGSEQAIRAGEVNWMIAGSGITHSERFEKARAEGDSLHGIQSWVALPDGMEEIAPAFFHHGEPDLPAFSEDRWHARLIAGDFEGLRAKVKTHSPMFYVHLDMAAGGRAALPSNHEERGAYIVSGRVESGGQIYEPGRLLVFKAGEDALVKAETQATIMAFGGAPLGERFIEWNFVSSSKERIEQAKADWRAGRMKLPDLDHDEFIPLPA